MLNKYFLKLFPILLFGITSAQQSIKGTVVIDFEDVNPENIHVLNKTQNIYTTTDIVGHFNIQAQENDTIIFSGSFLQERNFVVNSWALNNPDLVIHMNMEKIKLEELVVKPKLTGFIKKDVRTVPKDDTKEKLYASLGIDIKVLDIKPEEKRASLLPSLLTLNVEAVYKILSGYYRNMENLREYEKYMATINNVRDFLGKDFFVTYLNLPETEIEQFLIFVQGQDTQKFKTYYQTKNYLSLSALLEEEVEPYKQRLKQRDLILKENNFKNSIFNN
ncbi:hypothetical protein KRX57_03445 [Weeksellaceae bacterium TAE3-ERU29]|nr:hypothetical protein [Weeksellaceae bacterium TAE3-ERU29]